AGSKLSLALLNTLGQVALRIWAFKGGEVDLPMLATITSTSQALKNVDIEAAAAGSKIDLSGLTSFTAATVLPSASTVTTQATSPDPKLTTFNGVAVTLDGTGVVSTSQWTSLVNGFLTQTGGLFSSSNLTSVDGSQLLAQNGASITLSNLASYTD